MTEHEWQPITSEELLGIIGGAARKRWPVLNLSGQGVTELPAEIGQLANLQTLKLSHNQLTSLPESIGQLTNLQSLELSQNELTSLPDSIGQLTNLHTSPRLRSTDSTARAHRPTHQLAEA